MRKILSLLLILALFLPCALAETPQGIDLALTSTYGDGLSLRMTAGLGETPFCSLPASFFTAGASRNSCSSWCFPSCRGMSLRA